MTAGLRNEQPYVQDSDLTIHLGDVREVLPTLEAESVDCVATSPPFYALRDYGTGQWEGGDADCDHIKREPRPGMTDGPAEGHREEFRTGAGSRDLGASHFRDVCGKCGARRVDKQIGLEASPEEWCAELVAVFAECRRVLKPSGTLWIECGDSYNAYNGNRGASESLSAAADVQRNETPRGLTEPDLKAKDLLGTPWMLAFALRADGWWLRQCVIWAKSNAMPESATDRCTTAHSYVFLLSKSPRYWFDADAIAEPAAWERWGDQTVPKHEGTQTASGWMQPKTKTELHDELKMRRRGTASYESGGLAEGRARLSADGGGSATKYDGMKNARSVWTIPTRGYPGAHFATWPEALAERIIKAGCPEGGTVLDPFFGAGTTGLVARRLGRKCVGVELNESYAAMAAERLSQLSLLAEASA